MDISTDVDFVVAMELSLFAFNIIKHTCRVLHGFSLFLMKYANKTYDIFDVRPNIEKSLDGFMFYSLRTWGFHCGRT